MIKKKWINNLFVFEIPNGGISYSNDYNDDGYNDLSSMLLRSRIVYLFNPNSKKFETKSIRIGNGNFEMINKEKRFFFDDYDRDLYESNLFVIKELKQEYLYQIKYLFLGKGDSVNLVFLKMPEESKIKTKKISIDKFDLKNIWIEFINKDYR
ncbi:MAG: hypothetical protein H6604_00640 [Flavobacteriales bacterium]|nr:hypothetical protein [Flavobacteriales bacterium]